jgi:hypothetical protein
MNNKARESQKVKFYTHIYIHIYPDKSEYSQLKDRHSEIFAKEQQPLCLFDWVWKTTVVDPLVSSPNYRIIFSRNTMQQPAFNSSDDPNAN